MTAKDMIPGQWYRTLGRGGVGGRFVYLRPAMDEERGWETRLIAMDGDEDMQSLLMLDLHELVEPAEPKR